MTPHQPNLLCLLPKQMPFFWCFSTLTCSGCTAMLTPLSFLCSPQTPISCTSFLSSYSSRSLLIWRSSVVAVLESSWSLALGEPPKACMSHIKVPISVFCPKCQVNTTRSLCKFELRPIVLMIGLSLWFMQNCLNKVTSNWPVQETLAIITLPSQVPIL